MMIALRQIVSMLREGFPSRGTWLAAAVLLVLLDTTTFLGLIWRFLLRDALPASPGALIVASLIYLLLVTDLAFLAFGFGRLRCIRAAVWFYLSVGLYFLASGVLARMSREIATWPWVLVWIVTLIQVVVIFSGEMDRLNETPRK
jgi:hypothetical protein